MRAAPGILNSTTQLFIYLSPMEERKREKSERWVTFAFWHFDYALINFSPFIFLQSRMELNLGHTGRKVKWWLYVSKLAFSSSHLISLLLFSCFFILRWNLTNIYFICVILLYCILAELVHFFLILRFLYCQVVLRFVFTIRENVTKFIISLCYATANSHFWLQGDTRAWLYDSVASTSISVCFSSVFYIFCLHYIRGNVPLRILCFHSTLRLFLFLHCTRSTKVTSLLYAILMTTSSS